MRVTLVDQGPIPWNRKNKACVIDFEKAKKPCYRPLHNDHHEYHLIYGFERDVITGSYIKDNIILIWVSRE